MIAFNSSTFGGLLSVRGKRILGWARDPSMPQQPLTVHLFINEDHAATAQAVLPLSAILPHHGVDITCGFEFLLQERQLQSTNPAEIDVRFEIDSQSHSVPGFPVKLQTAFAQTIYGEVQSLGAVIKGWARDPERPECHLEVEMLIDNKPQLRSSCRLFSPELWFSGLEDGCHAFSFTAPRELLRRPESVIEIRLLDGTLLKNGRFSAGTLLSRMSGLRCDNIFKRQQFIWNEGIVELYDKDYLF